MSLLTGETVVDIDTARKSLPLRPAVRVARKEPVHARTVLTAPPAVRQLKNILWTAVISITLACIALLAGAIDIFVAANLTPLVEGAGLASIAFGLAGLSDKLDSSSRGR